LEFCGEVKRAGN